MIILGIPILFYLIGFTAVCLANRWWTFLPVSTVIFAAEWRYRGLGTASDGMMADAATRMLTLTVIGTVAGFLARALLLATGWSALRGRGLALTLVVLVAGPLAYAAVQAG